jgi:hypothetical protein
LNFINYHLYEIESVHEPDVNGFTFFFFLVLGIEPRVFCYAGTLPLESYPLPFLAVVIFCIGSHVFAWGQLQTGMPLPMPHT